MSQRRSSWIIISFSDGRRLRSPTPILRGAILITSFQYETWFSTLSQQGLQILSSSWETVFPTPFSRDMVQQDRHGHPFPSTILYGSEVWRSCLLESDWASIEKVQTLLLLHQMQSSNPQPIILAKFGVWPFQLEILFNVVSFLHHIQSFVDLAKGQDRYPYLAYSLS
jgi:hypothetical protein